MIKSAILRALAKRSQINLKLNFLSKTYIVCSNLGIIIPIFLFILQVVAIKLFIFQKIWYTKLDLEFSLVIRLVGIFLIEYFNSQHISSSYCVLTCRKIIFSTSLRILIKLQRVCKRGK